MWLPLGFFSLLVVSIAGQASRSLPEELSVVIAQGTVLGSLSNNGHFAEFYGIPYADATSGTNRFKAPNPAPSFQNTFIANRKEIKCVRALGAGYEGTEDCLVANVFTPTLDSTQSLPVMVWVKGKEFRGVNDPELSFSNFVDKNVVVVSLNYRESILGFLCLGTETAPGNAGLKDIVAGLRWVKENIAQFGGNPEDITLVGHGSGAAAVDLITMSSTATGLVNKAIVQSGSALSPWAVSRNNLAYAVQVAEALGHHTANIEDEQLSEDLSEIFKRTSIAALMGVINDLDLKDNSLAFAPCLERESLEGSVPFLVKSPYEILQSGEFLRIPLIIGYVDNEGTIRSEEAVEDDWMSKMDESFEEFLQPDLKFADDEEQTQVAQIIRAQYFQNLPIDNEHVENYINYHGDTMILVSVLREVRLRATVSDSPIYLYQFSYKGSLGEPFAGPLSVDGAGHSEELAYMFFDTFVTDDDIPERDLTIGDILVERWTNFAKYALPESEISRIPWEPYIVTQSSYLRFLDNDEIIDEATLEVHLQNPYPETMSFWDQVYAEHFLDADSQLTDLITDEDEDGDEQSGDGVGEESGDGSGDGSGEGSGDGSGDGSGEGSGDECVEGEDDDECNSASTTAGYTLTIITLFGILSKFQSSQLLS